MVSTAAIAVISAGWLAGFIYLLRFLAPSRNGAARQSNWEASLAAFAAGPFLVALFFLGTEFTRLPAPELVAYPLAAGVVLLLVFARRGLRLLAERLLLSFFLWMGILVTPTFWRDPVNEQMTAFLFGLLRSAGLLT